MVFEQQFAQSVDDRGTPIAGEVNAFDAHAHRYAGAHR